MDSISSSSRMHLLLLLLINLARTPVLSHSWHVKTLPGFSGELPVYLETGYISVGDVEFFYYFIRSQGNPGVDPLMLYLNGGPGCSGLTGLFYQIGPLKFNISDYTGGLPTLFYEPNTWTKTANIIFLDAPVGAGFSYATTEEAWTTNDAESAAQTNEFLRNWLNEHPDFTTNPVFIGSDSYAGVVVPILAQDIINGNKAGVFPRVNLKGYTMGCPHTNDYFETNSRIEFAHRMALISDEMYEDAKNSCHGDYVNIDSSNAKCIEALSTITQCIGQVSGENILYPKCASLNPKEEAEGKPQRYLSQNPRSLILPSSRVGDFWCHNFEYLLSDVWANYRRVREALNVRQGTVREFFSCNITLSYSSHISDVLPYHKNLTNTGLQILVFSGDHDMIITHIAIEQWINSLALTKDSDWRPWFIDGQVGGYTEKYTNNGYRLTYATIKGAGHSPTESKREECYDMFNRWIHYYPL